MEHGGRANSDGNSNRNNEDIEKEQVEGGGLDSGDGNEISDMPVVLEQDQMEEQLQGNADAEGVVRTSEDAERMPVPQGERGALPQTSEKVDIPTFSSIETGKQFVLPDARARSRRDQVSGLAASKATKMRAEFKRVQAVTYQVRAETTEGMLPLREKIQVKVNGGALWEEGVFMEWACVTPTHRRLWEADRGASDFFLAKRDFASIAGGDGEESKRHEDTLEGVCRLVKGGGRGDTVWVRQLSVLLGHHAWYRGHQEGTAVGAGRVLRQAWV